MTTNQTHSAPGASALTAATVETAPGESQPVLLFVDDEPNILRALRRVFHGQGYRLLLAQGGEEGLAFLRQERVDVVISDMRMPGMDGAQFLEHVRAGWPDVVRILLTGYSEISATVAAINRGEIYRYIAKPWDDNDILLIVREALAQKRLKAENIRLLAVTQSQNAELKALNANLETLVASRTAALKQAMKRLELSNTQLKKSFFNTVNAFSGLIEMREGRLGGHSRRVANQARRLARGMGMAESEIQDVMLAGLLHDIGKIGLPDDILKKPFNTLTADERNMMVRHPVTGELALMSVESLSGPAKLIRHHHERFDGNGYPDGLAGLAIPLGARVLAVVNDYDSLQLGTLVNRPISAAEARRFIADNAAKRYDPEVVRVFLEHYADGDASRIAEDEDITLPYRPADLKPGMVLAHDLMHREGYLLLAHGFVLDARMIEQLVRLERSESQVLVLQIKP